MEDFWNSTFEEVLFVIKGHIDNLRGDRIRAWKIVEGFRGTRDMPDLCDFYALPYDDEIRRKDKQDVQESLEEWHQIASQEMSNFKWPEQSKN